MLDDKGSAARSVPAHVLLGAGARNHRLRLTKSRACRKIYDCLCNAPLAQLVEQGTFNPKAAGSTPSRRTIRTSGHSPTGCGLSVSAGPGVSRHATAAQSRSRLQQLPPIRTSRFARPTIPRQPFPKPAVASVRHRFRRRSRTWPAPCEPASAPAGNMWWPCGFSLQKNQWVDRLSICV